MMQIRREQLKVFYMEAAGPYRERAAAFVRDHFPEAYERLGSEAVAASIEASLDKSFRYELEGDQDVLVLLELMYRWGFEFDDDPAYPWVRGELTDPDLEPSTRLDLVVQGFARLSSPP